MIKNKMTTKTFTPKNIKLHWPLEREGADTLHKVSLRLPLYSDFLQIEQNQDLDDIDLELAYLEQLTGLTEADLLALKSPDYHALSLQLADYLQKQSSFFIPIKKDSYENIPLLKPVGSITKVSASLPTARAWKLIRKSKDDTDKANKIAVGACFSLSHEEMEQLTLPDWFLLLGRATDFFTKTGEYFSGKKIFAS